MDYSLETRNVHLPSKNQALCGKGIPKITDKCEKEQYASTPHCENDNNLI